MKVRDVGSAKLKNADDNIKLVRLSDASMKQHALSQSACNRRRGPS